MSVKRQAVSGVKWTSVATITLALSAILKISILTRFLEPSDFGLMALITFVLGFMDLFMDMGITSAILHKQNITFKEYASLYWLNILFSLVLFSLIVALSPFIASFYNQSELTKLIPLAGIAIVFSAIGRQYKTIFQKHLKFKVMAIVDISSIGIALIFAVLLAYYGYGVYALVYSALIQYGINNLVFFVLGIKSHPLLFHCKFAETKTFLKIGIFQVGGQIINYFNRDLDILIIGKFFGADILGGYSLAKQLVKRPQSIINPIINKVAIAILPKHQSNDILLLKYFNLLISKLSILNAFVYGAVALAAPIVIAVLYGNGYEGIVTLVRLFTIIIYFRSVSSLVGVLSITKGRTDIEFYWNVITAVVMPLVMFIGVNVSTEFIVLLIGITQMLLIFPMWYMFYYKQVNMSWHDILRNIFFPFSISLTFYFIYSFINYKGVLIQIMSCVVLFIVLSIYTFKSDNEILNYIKSSKHIKFLLRRNRLE